MPLSSQQVVAILKDSIATSEIFSINVVKSPPILLSSALAFS